MSKTFELAPGCTAYVEEATAHHWVATCGTLVIVLLHEGSYADPQHVRAGERAITRLVRRGAAAVQMLVIFPSTLSKPPSAEVRRAIVDAASVKSKIDRAAGVVLGSGFMSAIHRGAVTGILALVGAPGIVRVVSSVTEGLEHIYGRHASTLAPLARLCNERVAEGARAATLG
jgi:hypothetical protein